MLYTCRKSRMFYSSKGCCIDLFHKHIGAVDITHSAIIAKFNILGTYVYTFLSDSYSYDARIGGCWQNGLLVPRSLFSRHGHFTFVCRRQMILEQKAHNLSQTVMLFSRCLLGQLILLKQLITVDSSFNMV